MIEAQTETHFALWLLLAFALWLLLAFALGTLWQPTVQLMWSGFIVDNGRGDE